MLADTAGRLQTKTPLMDELKKIVRTMQKASTERRTRPCSFSTRPTVRTPSRRRKCSRKQSPSAASSLPSWTARPKGGVILGICDEHKIPVRYVGLGERAEDLREFVADEFVEALFGASAEETAAA